MHTLIAAGVNAGGTGRFLSAWTRPAPRTTWAGWHSMGGWPAAVWPPAGPVRRRLKLTLAIHTKVESSLIMWLSCGNTLKPPQGARTFWVQATSSVSAGHTKYTVKIVTNRG